MDFMEEKLKSTLFRLDCPDNLELGEFAMGLLDSSQQTLHIGSHISKCPHCLADLAQIRHFMETPLVDQSLAHSNRAKHESIIDKVRVIVVDFLSPPQGLFLNPSLQPAIRGASGELATQVFQVESYIIALSAVKKSSSWKKQQIIGDISPVMGNVEDFHSWSAYLWRDGQLLATTPVDRDSHFIFKDIQLADQPHELILSGPRVEIHLQNLQMN